MRALTALAVVLLVGAVTGLIWIDRRQRLDDAAERAMHQARHLATELGDALALARLLVEQADARLQAAPGDPRLQAAPGDSRLQAAPPGIADTATAITPAAPAEFAALLDALPIPFELHAIDAQGRLIALTPAPSGQAHGRQTHEPRPLPPPSSAQGWFAAPTTGAAGARILPLVRAAAPNAHGIVAWAADFSHAGLMRRIESARDDEAGAAGLLRIEPDGALAVLARVPERDGELGRRLRGPLAEALQRAPAGSFLEPGSLDGTPRVVGYRRLDADAAGLVVAWGLGQDAVLAPWRARLPALAAALAALAGLVIWGGRRLERELDATARGHAALARSEASFRSLADHLPDVVMRIDAGGRYLYVNPAAAAATGLDTARMLGRTASEIGLPAAADEVWAGSRERVFAGGQGERIEVELPGADGPRIWESNIVPEPGDDARPAALLVISRDITGRRRVEDELRASELRFRLAASFGQVWEWDLAARRVNFPDAFWRALGHEPPAPAESVAALEALVDPADRARRHEALAAHLRDGTPYDLNVRVRDAKGRVRWFHTQGQALRDAAGRASYMAGTAFEVTDRLAAEEALRASQARLAHLLRTAPSVIYTAQAHGERAATYYSANVAALLGWAPEQLLADPGFWRAHLHPDDAPQVLARWPALAEHDELLLEYRFQHADGRWRWIQDRARLVRDDAGRPAEIVGSWTDISERREAEHALRGLADELEARVQSRTAELTHSEARWRKVVDTVPVALLEEDWTEVLDQLDALRAAGVVDATRYFAAHPDAVERCLRAVRVRHANRAALALHDALDRAQPLTGLGLFFPGEESLAQFADELEAIWAGRRTHSSKRSLPSLSGRPLSLLLTMSLPTREDPGALVCLLDITEIDRLNAELAASVARLRAVNRELETFSYSVSHDLKAPLRGIDGYSRLLLADHAGQLDAEGRQFLLNIRQAARQMGELIDDLLAYSRLERRELAIGAVELAPAVAQLISGLPPADAARLRVAIEPGLRAHADAQGLALALRNLLDNALKFSAATPGSHIEIGAEVVAGADGDARRVRLWVRDNGPGFDMRFHDRIFAIFQRLHRAEEFPGTGVGLAIVRKAMERMGGRAWADSRPGAGATFFLELPQAS